MLYIRRKYAKRGLQIWRSVGMQSPVEEIIPPAIACLCSLTLCEWHLGEVASSRAAIAEAISLAKELNNMHAVADALSWAAIRIAKEQKSVSLEKRAEKTYAEYRRRKASGSGGRGFRLSLW